MKYFNDFFNKIKYEDDFGYHSYWNIEIDKWLGCLYEIDRDFYNKSRKRVVRPFQRDEFLGEVKALYFINEKMGNTILKMEPLGSSEHKLDFSFTDKESRQWVVEVKTNSWLKDIWQNKQLSDEEKLDRAKLPQYINGEVQSFSFIDDLKTSVDKALFQFERGQNNLLIIFPSDSGKFATIPLLNSRIIKTIQLLDPLKIISAVCFLDIIYPCIKNKVVYNQLTIYNK